MADFTGDFTLPSFTFTGEFEEAYKALTGDMTLPAFDLSGSYVSSNVYAGEFELPRFSMSGELAIGQVFAGDFELPLFALSGELSSPYFAGVLELPSFFMSARLEQSITSVFRAWVANTRNNALTEYTNFPFNSFARFNGEYLAAGSGGIIALTGDDDDGTDIDARVRLATTDLGMAELKRVEEAFLSYRSEGRLVLRLVIDGGQTYEYPLEPTGQTGIYQARVKLGRGLKLNYICLEILNFEGADFDLDAIRMKPIVLSRWIG